MDAARRSRRLELIDHQHDVGPGRSPSTVDLAAGVLTTSSDVVTQIVDGQRRRLAMHLGRSPTDTELFEHLAGWSNGYVGGHEL